MRIRLVIQYDGTNYVGWQTQPNGVSVEEVMERELFKLTGERTVLHASGRTDSGVHARAQTAHFDTSSRIPPEKFAYALNAGLPPDIRVSYSGETSPCFHARYDVLKKHYRYAVCVSKHMDVFERLTSLHVHYPLDVGLMNTAARAAVGEHDFAAFKSTGVEQKSTVRNIYSSEWTKAGKMLYYDVSGSGFMYNMVRILVGTMLEIGGGRREPSAIEKALESGDRRDAGATAPAHGLTLMRVEYADFDTDDIWC